MTGDCFVCRQLSLNKPSKNLGDVAALKGLKWDSSNRRQQWQDFSEYVKTFIKLLLITL